MDWQNRWIYITSKVGYFWNDFCGWLLVYLIFIILLVLAVIGLKKWHPSNKCNILKISVGNLLILIALSIHLLYGFELYYRYVFDETDNILQIKTTQRWFDRHVVYNAFTFRDEHFPGDKDPEELRLAVIGDSFAFGYGVKNPADRMNEKLKVKIKMTCGKSRVHAVARPGMDTIHELEFFNAYVANRHYDGVVLSYFLNDEAGDDKVTFLPWYGQINGWRKKPIVGFLMKNSFALEYFLVHLSLNSDPQVTKGADYYGSLYRSQEVWEKHTKTLDKFIEATRINKIPFMVVIFPVMNTIGEQYPYKDVHQKLVSYFEQKSIPVINLEPEFSSLGPGKLMISKRDFHPNETAHSIAAEAIYQKIKEINWVRCPKTSALPERPLL